MINKIDIYPSGEKVAENFTMNEFYCKSVNAPLTHPFDNVLIEAAQSIRDEYAAPVTITSTYRTLLGNLAAGGKSGSLHLTGEAMDFKMSPDKLTELKEDIRKKGKQFKKLRLLGIRGFGLYPTFVHLDTRGEEYPAANTDSKGSFAFWDMEKKTAIELDEDKPQKKIVWSTVGIFLLFVLFLLVPSRN